jgi:hypothetical protein
MGRMFRNEAFWDGPPQKILLLGAEDPFCSTRVCFGIRSSCIASCFGLECMAAYSLLCPASSIRVNRKGWCFRERGGNISAVPSTGPMGVTNINLTSEPWGSSSDEASNPPVSETHCNSLGVRRPFSTRRTTGVISVGRNRGERLFEEGWGRSLILQIRVCPARGQNRMLRKDLYVFHFSAVVSITSLAGIRKAAIT